MPSNSFACVGLSPEAALLTNMCAHVPGRAGGGEELPVLAAARPPQQAAGRHRLLAQPRRHLHRQPRHRSVHPLQTLYTCLYLLQLGLYSLPKVTLYRTNVSSMNRFGVFTGQGDCDAMWSTPIATYSCTRLLALSRDACVRDTGSTQQHWPFPSSHVDLGYAYLFTHPGTCCVQRCTLCMLHDTLAPRVHLI